MSNGTVFIFGCGYSAQYLAHRLLRAGGWSVTGTTRSADGAKRLAASGITPLIWPGTDLQSDLAQATHLLISAGPEAEGDPVLRQAAEQIAGAAPHLRWVGYLSTTGVYGDHAGGWVDESSPLTPSTQRGRWRVEAETGWQGFAALHNLPLHIFRLAGIYGPGRGPFAKLSSGTARRIIKPGQVFSRIHVEDIAQILQASMGRPNPGGIYNLCDDDPAPPEAVITEAARLLCIEPPPEEDFAAAEMTPMARSFYAESKRVRNDRIKAELGIQLIHPDYRSGLRDLLKVETSSSDVSGGGAAKS